MARPWITCHVLDTITGRPAASITVTLRLLSPAQSRDIYFFALTNADGRVTGWTPSKPDLDLTRIIDKIKNESGEDETSAWSLVFEVEEYFGKGKCFYPEVEIKFSAKKTEEHYHVPLLGDETTGPRAQNPVGRIEATCGARIDLQARNQDFEMNSVWRLIAGPAQPGPPRSRRLRGHGYLAGQIELSPGARRSMIYDPRAANSTCLVFKDQAP
ncbi:hypothetical protein B0A48_17216 [Cryoendolithus antarcticus]|uniref:Transthyretin/hydroxyisourate hydrolase domain-containing protein n=1 Tax=Cryoendolithus antarcticus TaxID=1507870 RepID=A0A1V8SDV6_9PEZI|nr:hypothetical protein B0A48_17216 [Cryoendolithus antarcticus]